MTFAEILKHLPSLTFEQRQEIIRCIDEIDDLPLSPEVEAMVETRFNTHEAAPHTAIPWEEMKERLQNLSKPK